MSETPTSIVIVDTGSYNIKCGKASEDEPLLIPNLISENNEGQRQMGHSAWNDTKNTYKCPLNNESKIQDWNSMEKLWSYSFNLCNSQPKDQAFLLSLPVNVTRLDKERITQTYFEHFNVPALNLSSAATLALFASGKYSGLVIDCGESQTTAVPVFDGLAVNYASVSTPLAGNVVTNVISDAINKEYNICLKRPIINKAKETLSNVSINSSNETSKEFIMPDGTPLKLNYSERSKSGDSLFEPSKVSISNLNVHQVALYSILKVEMDQRTFVEESICICGGTSKIPGFVDRISLELELSSRVPSTSIIATDDRDLSVWKGGSILAALSTFQQMWVTKTEYDEHGPNAIHRKCQP